MFKVTIGSPLWNCAFTATHKRRIKAFRAALASVMHIPDISRPGCTDASLEAAYASLAAWDRRSKATSPRMMHEPGSRAWYLEIERLP